MEEENDYDEKVQKLESIFGDSGESVLHASIPFFVGQEDGGASDVFIFPNHKNGIAYATFDLIGNEEQVKNKIGNYELAICHKEDNDWGADLISQLAYYTLKEELNTGETMDIGDRSEGEITALLFHEYGNFTFKNEKSGVLMCIGINEKELNHSKKHGSKKLISALQEKGVYPFTVFNRPSVV